MKCLFLSSLIYDHRQHCWLSLVVFDAPLCDEKQKTKERDSKNLLWPLIHEYQTYAPSDNQNTPGGLAHLYVCTLVVPRSERWYGVWHRFARRSATPSYRDKKV